MCILNIFLVMNVSSHSPQKFVPETPIPLTTSQSIYQYINEDFLHLQGNKMVTKNVFQNHPLYQPWNSLMETNRMESDVPGDQGAGRKHPMLMHFPF